MKKLAIIPLCLIVFGLHGQWSNRYPKVDGYGHHVYLEAFELPVLNSGPTDPAPSPDGKQVAFAAKGFIWIMDLSDGIARQVTRDAGADARPGWSPDGRSLVFIRDDSRDTKVMLFDLENKLETELVNSDRLELDPIFSNDGQKVYFSSAANGSLDLWEINLATRVSRAITNRPSLERLPVPVPGHPSLVYLKKQGFSYDHIEKLDLATGKTDTLVADNFVSQASFTLSPDGRTLAYTWPYIDQYDIRLIDLNRPDVPLILTKTRGLPLWPKFSADGEWIYYTQMNTRERAEIFRVHVSGAVREQLKVSEWQWSGPMQTIIIQSLVDGSPTPVRMHITDNQGHPIIPENTAVHSEGEHGLVFFYSPGEIQLTVPLGTLTVTAVHGFETKAITQQIQVTEMLTGADIALNRLWDANAQGWYAGDNHFHLNYGGAYRLNPEDILPEMQGEGMDIAFPLVANIHNRYLEEDLFGWRHADGPIIQFGQEVRSHFLGHLNVIGADSLFWPWIWGPGYDVYGRADRTNGEVVRFARNQGGMAGYVHPVGVSDPFSENGARRVPVELVADCVLGECDMIEVACLWTDEIGTASVWHELLNLGIPVALSAGSDVMNDYYRTMAIGATRLYVKPEGILTVNTYLEAMKKGNSFVTNGPLIDFEVGGAGPGGEIRPDGKKVRWTLDVHTPVPIEKIELFVNGQVVWTRAWKKGAGSDQFKGNISLPAGGWVTARVSGGASVWPVMDSYPYAETSPVWIGKTGSWDNTVRISAATKLLQLLEVSEQRLRSGYGDTPIPKLESQFRRAKDTLTDIRQTQPAE